MGLLHTCIEFFGLRPGQSRMEFMKDEYKQLTPSDRAEIEAGLKAQGWNISIENSWVVEKDPTDK